MKTLFFFLCLVGLSAQAQTVERVIIDSIASDSVKTVYYRVVRITRDTTPQNSTTYEKVLEELQQNQAKVNFNQMAVKVQAAYLRDTLGTKGDPGSKQYVKDQLHLQRANLNAYTQARDFQQAIKVAIKRELKLK